MARVAGVNIPTNKRVEVALTYIFGIGDTTARKICDKLHVGEGKRVYELTEDELSRLREEISSYTVEGDLRKKIASDIGMLIGIRCYRGIRHTRKLPVRGQRTRTNAHTRKGKRIPIAGKKKATKK